MTVVRFRYGPKRWEALAYNGGIMANLRRNPFLLLVLPIFLGALLWSTVRLLREFRPEAVHAHWIVPQGVVLAMALGFVKARPRTVCTVHGSDVSALHAPPWAWLRRRVASHLDALVAVSHALRDRLVSEGCRREGIAVIPMGTDLRALFHPDEASRPPASLLFVGRLVPGKGADVLVRAMPRILAHCPGATLTLVGDGPEHPILRELVRAGNVADVVRFEGALPHRELPARYRAATMLVLPSREEGFGLVLVEAMGCGCPVVASDLPSVRELVVDGETGRLFQPGDPESLAHAVLGHLADPSARGDMAEKARGRALDYDWERIAERYMDIIDPRA